jgi:hypothetical protein
MYGMKVYIKPQDIIDQLSDEDKQRFNQCIFTDVARDPFGEIEISCVLLKDPDSYVELRHRQRYFGDSELTVDEVE